MRTVVPLAGLLALALPIGEAAAQSLGTVKVRAGLGIQTQPEWPGADDNEWSLYPNFSIVTGEGPFGFGAPDDSLSIKLISTGGFSAGPVLALQGSRKESEVGAPVGKVGTTVEAGAFAQYYVGESVRLRGEVRKGLGGHEGLIGHVGADYVARDEDRYVFSIGPRLLFSDDRYQRAYFGVSPEAALATGLDVYRPDGGLHAIAATSGLQYSLGGGFGLFGYARYERLVGDARKSPIVRELGSPNQFSAGVGVNYTFALKL